MRIIHTFVHSVVQNIESNLYRRVEMLGQKQ